MSERTDTVDLTTTTRSPVTLLHIRPEPKDPSRKHFRISMVKSMLRFVGYWTLPLNLWVAAVILVAAELLGVLEEL